jgi:hypothetical protein
LLFLCTEALNLPRCYPHCLLSLSLLLCCPMRLPLGIPPCFSECSSPQADLFPVVPDSGLAILLLSVSFPLAMISSISFSLS